jgi:hypothetical protein
MVMRIYAGFQLARRMYRLKLLLKKGVHTLRVTDREWAFGIRARSTAAPNTGIRRPLGHLADTTDV